MIKHIIEVYDAQTGAFKEAVYLNSQAEVDNKMQSLQDNGHECEYIGTFEIDESVTEFLSENV